MSRLLELVISGYAKLKSFQEAYVIFERMNQEGVGVQPNCITFSRILNVCASVAMLEYGMRVHNFIIECTLDIDIYIKSALIDMYVKCGGFMEARFIFDQEAVTPDLITFIMLLYVCNHSGLLCGVYYFFRLMSSHFGLIPTGDHFACVIDVFGRVGHLSMAIEGIEQLPLQPDAEIWMSLFGACRIHGCARLAEYAVDQIVNLKLT